MDTDGRRPGVWVVGSVNIDLHLTVQRHPRTGETVLADDLLRRFGGKGANQAVAAAFAGAPTQMVAAVGDDTAGADYLRRLREFGVATDTVRVIVGAATGTAVISVDADHDNMIMVAPGANHRLTTEDVDTGLAGVGAGDVVVLQLEIPLPVAEHTIRTASARGARVVANLAPYADLDPDLLARCDPVVVNESEHAGLTRAGIEVPSLLVTRGSQGSGWGAVSVPAPTADVVDTTGAGDAYVGALAAALAAGEDRGEAMRAASLAAAECIAHPGAQPDPPR